MEEKIIVTEGDRLQTGPLWNVGGKGLWVNEIERALLSGAIDLAVHSMKDLPGQITEGLVLAAVPPRADPRDALISRSGAALADLPLSARVGTTSLRRTCQLKAVRQDLDVQILRGNLDTRLRRVDEGTVDAAILACAGLERLGLASRISERLSLAQMLPAVGQGALAIEARADDEGTQSLCRPLDHEESAIAVSAERSFLARLGASCRTPVAAHCILADGQATLSGLVGRPNGSEILVDRVTGASSEAIALGAMLADRLLKRGAGAILAINK